MEGEEKTFLANVNLVIGKLTVRSMKNALKATNEAKAECFSLQRETKMFFQGEDSSWANRSNARVEEMFRRNENIPRNENSSSCQGRPTYQPFC
jgi:hypothetical protein